MKKPDRQKTNNKWKSLLDGNGMGTSISTKDWNALSQSNYGLNGQIGTSISNGSGNLILDNTGAITTTTGTGTITIGNNNYSNYFIGVDPYQPKNNDNEILIDISKKIVTCRDFTGLIHEYNLKSLKSIIEDDNEIHTISIERELLPGELKKLIEFRKKEILIEFCDELLDERDGSQYAEINIFAGFPHIQSVIANTIGQDFIQVQPMAAPTGILHYLDYTYRNPNEIHYGTQINDYTTLPNFQTTCGQGLATTTNLGQAIGVSSRGYGNDFVDSCINSINQVQQLY